MMELTEAMKKRHSVRSYEDKKIDGNVKESLLQFIDKCNQESGLHMQLVLDEPQAFDSLMAHYGHFSGVKNYIAVVGKKGTGTEEACGYYGEKVVLYAQQLGLNTCWVAMTFKNIKNAYRLRAGEKLYIVIAIGYGKTEGTPHISKSAQNVVTGQAPMPDWFRKGVEAALLAPTAMNQQKFRFSLSGSQVSAKPGTGFYSKIDLGIAKYHFEIGAGEEHFTWG